MFSASSFVFSASSFATYVIAGPFPAIMASVVSTDISTSIP
jgi:hypothetical protein